MPPLGEQFRSNWTVHGHIHEIVQNYYVIVTWINITEIELEFGYIIMEKHSNQINTL